MIPAINILIDEADNCRYVCLSKSLVLCAYFALCACYDCDVSSDRQTVFLFLLHNHIINKKTILSPDVNYEEKFSFSFLLHK